MRLVNPTSAPAKAIVATTTEAKQRRGMVVAKLSFRIDAAGVLAIDRDAPAPILVADAKHELGVLPGDLAPVASGRCEIIALAQAYAPGGKPATSQRIELAVGEHRRAIDVFGDRTWRAGPTGQVASAPQPYLSMPLVWERAFGGSTAVWLDKASSIAVADEINPTGRGFDPRARAKALGEVMYCAPGYPVVQPDDALPNLEDPRAPIGKRSDAPDPVCWATLPIGAPLRWTKWIRLAQAAGKPPTADAMAEAPRARCHPEWLVTPPSVGTPIELRGMTPDGRLRFAFPAVRPLLDYHVGAKQGTRELVPVRVVLLPDERRFQVLFATRFTVAAPERGEQRSLRLRLVDEARVGS